MIDTLMNHEWVDDYKILTTNHYIQMRQEYYPTLNEDFSLIKSYESMVVISISYPSNKVDTKGEGYGLLARYSHGRDYHLIFRDLFLVLENRFAKKGIKAKGYSDISPIDERFAGSLAGLGYIGKNQLLIHPHYGTYHNIGVLLIDHPYSTTPYIADDCGDCSLCKNACPTNALESGFIKEKCLSYLSQTKEDLSIQQLKPMKTMLFGCDICQEVCPKNKGITSSNRNSLQDQIGEIHLESLLRMSNKSIVEQYKNYAFIYRGGLILKRNALGLLLNQKQIKLLPLIKEVAHHYQHVSWFYPTAIRIIKEMEQEA